MKRRTSQDPGNDRHGRVLAISLFATLAFAAYLRLSYITYGLPYLYNGDELINVRVIQSMLQRRSLDPEFHNYPALLFYLNLPAQFLFRNLSGNPGTVVSQSMGNGYAPQPGALLLARLVTVGFGVATVAASWQLARNIGLRLPFMLLAALMVSATPLLVRHSSYVTPDMIASFFATTTLAASVTIADRSDWRTYVVAGILAGLAAATKYNAGLVALSIPVAHLAGHRFHRAVPMMLLAGACTLLGLLIASPYLLLNNVQAINDILYELRHYRTGHPGAEGDSLKTNALWLFRQTGWTCLFLAGLVFARDRWRQLAPIAFFVLAYFFLLSVQVVRFDRNLLPMLPATFVLLAAGAQELAKKVPQRPFAVAIAGLFLAAVVAGPIAGSMRELGNYVRDPRAGVRAWLEDYTSDGQMIAVDAYSPYLKARPGTRVVGKYSVLSLPMDELLGMDYVAVRSTSPGRVGDTGRSPQAAAFETLSLHACDTATYPAAPARPKWTVFKFNCP